MTIFIGQQIADRRCTQFKLSADGKTTSCLLPPGMGQMQPVTAVQGNSFSQPIAGVYLSYASPAISNVTGCQSPAVGARQTSQSVERCILGATITINGYNFGPSGATVRIDDQDCTNVVHDPTTPHNRVTCTLPTARPSDQPLNHLPILLFNAIGEQSGPAIPSNAPVTVSYYECPLGTRPDGDRGCSLCAAGTYSITTNAYSCVVCSAGTYSSGGSEVCRTCERGTYAPSAGSPGCAQCPALSYSSRTGAVACEMCAPGYVADSTQTGCVPCAAGQQGGGASGVCTNCPALSSSKPGSAVCSSCPAGESAPTQGDLCVPCMAGSYGPSIGGLCFPCDIGKV